MSTSAPTPRREPQSPGRTIVLGIPSAAKRTFFFLLSADLLLVVLDAALNRSRVVPYRAFRRLFNLAHDSSIGGWFSGAQALGTALLALGIAALQHSSGRSREGWGWGGVSLFFFYLSMDDAAKVHERLGTTFDKLAASGRWTFLEGYPSYTWQVTVGPFLALAALLAGIFLWRRLEGAGQKGMLTGASVCFAAALALDVVEGAEGVHRRIAGWTGLKTSFVSHYLRVAEEFLEMLGMSVILVLLLAVLLRHLDGTTFVTGRHREEGGG